MPTQIRRTLRLLVVCMALAVSAAAASAYNARPKLIVIVVIDQFRGDYPARYYDQLAPGGLRLFVDRGANFTDCYYGYANTKTAPGHATLGTGAYTDAHGIGGNEWWDPKRDEVIQSVTDYDVKMVGPDAGATGSSPHYLLASTLGDELRLATQGRSRVFGVALKDRAAILPTGHTANGAFWIEKNSGDWQTSTYYMKELPEWAANFNGQHRADKYWDLEWKDGAGKVLAKTSHAPTPRGTPAFYDVVGRTPYANEYTLEFARELIANEKLGQGETTDLLVVSLSANDILGHEMGPDSHEMAEMTVATDRQLEQFFGYLGRQLGMANVWLALSADHGIVPLPEAARKVHMPAEHFSGEELYGPLNAAVAKRLNKPVKEYVKTVKWPYAYLSPEEFAPMKEEEAEKLVGEEMMKHPGSRGYYTRVQLGRGDLRPGAMEKLFLHSYVPVANGSWYTMAISEPFSTPGASGVDHFSPYSYDRHVPLAFYGVVFQAGTYRTAAEPVDLAVTLASLLGINKPSHAIGRVLTEAIKDTPKKEQP